MRMSATKRLDVDIEVTVLDQQVGTDEQCVHSLITERADDRPLASTQEPEEGPVLSNGHRHGGGEPPQYVATHRFHLDHLGTGITEELAHHRTSDALSALDHTNARQRKRGGLVTRSVGTHARSFAPIGVMTRTYPRSVGDARGPDRELESMW